MKIMLTGRIGFIGQRLCPELLTAGHTLTVYSRYPDKVNAILGDHFDVIINLVDASIFVNDGRTNANKPFYITALILHKIWHFITRVQSKPKVFLSGSAIGFYGNQGDTILDET